MERRLHGEGITPERDYIEREEAYRERTHTERRRTQRRNTHGERYTQRGDHTNRELRRER